MSDAVTAYPAIRWDLPGLRPLQVSLILAVVATSLAGILSNPLFTLAKNSISHTPLLQAAIEQNVQAAKATKSLAMVTPANLEQAETDL